MIVESKDVRTFETEVLSMIFKAIRPGTKEMQILQVLVAELREARS